MLHPVVLNSATLESTRQKAEPNWYPLSHFPWLTLTCFSLATPGCKLARDTGAVSRPSLLSRPHPQELKQVWSISALGRMDMNQISQLDPEILFKAQKDPNVSD